MQNQTPTPLEQHKEELRRQVITFEGVQGTISQLSSDLLIAIEALEFYGNPTFCNVFFIDHETVENEYDKTARTALTQLTRSIESRRE